MPLPPEPTGTIKFQCGACGRWFSGVATFDYFRGFIHCGCLDKPRRHLKVIPGGRK